MKVLVTGAGGFVGARLAADLAADGHSVAALWHKDIARLSTVEASGATLVQGNLVDGDFTGKLVVDGGFDLIVHAAAAVSKREDPDFLRLAATSNVLATANLIAAAEAACCGRFLFTSTISVYGEQGAPDGGYLEAAAAPTSIYGWSKFAAEQLLDITASRVGMTAVSLRLAGVHGVGRTSGALAALIRSALAGSKMRLTDPDSLFRWAFIEDVSKAVKHCVDADIPVGHHAANLASADIFTLQTLAERIRTAAGSSSLIETVGNAARNEVMNIDKLKELIGFTPSALDDVLPAYIAAVAEE